MRKVLIIIFWFSFLNQLLGQNKMIVDKSFNGYTYYGEFSDYLDSISEIPSVIRYNVNGYLNRILGSMSDSVEFSHGQVVDLKRKFEQDSTTFGYSWIVPKYDLNFVLKDCSIGIKCYYLNIRLDEYGQILYSNWPNKEYADKSKFKSRTDIENYALEQAEKKGYNIDEYSVELQYNEKLNKLCWFFEFPVDSKESDAFEIDWKWIRIVDEYQLTRSIVY